jgi:hypothetical protein
VDVLDGSTESRLDEEISDLDAVNRLPCIEVLAPKSLTVRPAGAYEDERIPIRQLTLVMQANGCQGSAAVGE